MSWRWLASSFLDLYLSERRLSESHVATGRRLLFWHNYRLNVARAWCFVNDSTVLRAGGRCAGKVEDKVTMWRIAAACPPARPLWGVDSGSSFWH